MSEPERIEIESITTPGHIQRVDRAKYLAQQAGGRQATEFQVEHRSFLVPLLLYESPSPCEPPHRQSGAAHILALASAGADGAEHTLAQPS